MPSINDTIQQERKEIFSKEYIDQLDDETTAENQEILTGFEVHPLGVCEHE